ncbi:hypothetical protein BLOT_012007 [Blomia tropicalis]|nr:hypothetical protein BLOT_012007 [Blomia tropicalis]
MENKPEYAPTLKISEGFIRGTTQLVDEHKLHLYQGIKYGRRVQSKAERFQRALPVEPWNDVYDASIVRCSCPQLGLDIPYKGYYSFEYSEDSLFLNVWRPAKESSSGPRAVMFYIYGGGFKTGSVFKITNDGRYISARGDVIVVTANYRVGAFGFIELLPRMKDLAKELGCTSQNVTEIIEYLKKQSIEDILNITDKFELKFEPVYGDEVIPVLPINALLSGSFNGDVDLMYGVSKDEGLGFVGSIIPELKTDDVVVNDENVKDFIKRLFEYKNETFGDEAADFYISRYKLPSNPTLLDYKLLINNVYGEYNIGCRTILFAEYFALNSRSSSKRKYYSFMTIAPAEVHIMGALADNWPVACHADELYYLFTITRQRTEEDKRLSHQIIGAWANFAKYADPGPIQDVHWAPALTSPITLGSTNYMELNYQCRMMYDQYKEKIPFWANKIGRPKDTIQK